MKFLLKLTILLLFTSPLFAQEPVAKDEFTAISETLHLYIEGTSNGEPEKLIRAFHPDFNLYSVASDTLRIWKGKDYINGIKPGKKNNRIGRIISMDYEQDAATAKVEIMIPGWRVFTDYFLLLKYEGSWRIVHKSYSSRPVKDFEK